MSGGMRLLESVFKTSVQPIIVIDAFGIIQQYNLAAEKLFQYTAKEILGQNIKKIMPQKEAKKHDGYLKKYRKTHKKNIIGTGRNLIGQKKDGTFCNIFLSISEIKLDKKLFFAGMIHDITLEKKLAEYNQKLINFNLEIIQKIGEITDYHQLIENVLLHLSKLFNFDVGHFYEYDHYQDHLKSSHIFFLSTPRKHAAFVEITKKKSFKKGIGLPGVTWKEEKVTCYPNILETDNFPRAHLSKTPLLLKGGIAFPVIYNNKLLGVIEFYSEKILTLDINQIDLFEKFSKIISGLYGTYQEQRKLNLLLNNCGEGVYGLDTKGITTFVNPRACEILGYTADELIGSSMHEKIHYTLPGGKAYSRDACKTYQCISQNKPTYVDDEVFLSKSKKAIPVEYTVTPIIEHKNIVGGVVTFLDVSEKRKVKRHIEMISKLQERYIGSEQKDRLFDEVLNYLLEYTDSEYGFVGVVLKDDLGAPYLKTYSITNIAWNKAMRTLYEKNLKGGLEFRNLKTLFGYTLRTEKVVISNNPGNDKRAGGLPKGHPALNTYLGVPIFDSKGGLIAMYGLANRPNGYSQQVTDDLKPLTHAISSVVESIMHYKTIRKMARLDVLTGIYNRQYFDLKLNEVINKHRKKGESFCVLMLDLNNFKAINDTYGHQIGDEILILMTQRIQSVLNKSDVVARLGGDEFILVLQEVKDDKYVKQVASRLFLATEKTYQVQKKTIYCSMSMGIAYYPSSGKTSSTLLKHVDFALYEAKRNQDKWCVYSKAINQRYTSIMKLEEILGQALQKEAFHLVYQPQINLKTNEIVGLEALLRLKPFLKKEISPSIFIPMLEKFGHAEKLNEYVVRHVLKNILLLKNKQPFKVAINISPKVLKIDVHIEKLIQIIQENKKQLEEKQIVLEFEITESSFTHGSSNLLSKALNITKKAGISCAMDDFGVECSSISRLTQYPFDMVKIDQFFVHKLDKKQNKSAKAVIRALVQLANDLNFIILAEGPETKVQVEYLVEMGCQYVQGFYFYKPMSIKKINRLI